MRVLKWCLPVVLAVVIALPTLAQEKKRQPKRKAEKPVAKKAAEKQEALRQRMLFGFLKGIELTDEQKEKLAEIRKQFAPKLAELIKKRQAIYTEEQRKKVDEIRKKARAEGKKPQEIKKAIEEAVQLTEEQKKAMEQLGAELKKLYGEVREAVMKILTDEQKQALQKQKPRKGKKGKEAK